jgi:hypothetical protein
MIVCVKCKKEMTCVKTGYGVRFGEAHVYPGDLFECQECRSQVVSTHATPVHATRGEIPNTLQMD